MVNAIKEIRAEMVVGIKMAQYGIEAILLMAVGGVGDLHDSPRYYYKMLEQFTTFLIIKLALSSTFILGTSISS